jgi:hypothetical protein
MFRYRAAPKYKDFTGDTGQSQRLLFELERLELTEGSGSLKRCEVCSEVPLDEIFKDSRHDSNLSTCSIQPPEEVDDNGLNERPGKRQSDINGMWHIWT